MNHTIQLRAADGHSFDAYIQEAPQARAGLVILQEIFGVNHYVRSVVDRFAAEGFTAIAPALFDRAQRGVELGYDEKGMAEGRKLAYSLKREETLLDIEAAIACLRDKTGGGKVGVVGYCFGGSFAWMSATQLRPEAAVGYYGSQVAQSAQDSPHCPVLLHYGAKDAHIPLSDVDLIRAAHPEIPVHVYDAGHGFSCNERPSYVPSAAALADGRTLEFLRETLLR
jgi:carboxymethylenebutenolidase